MNTTVLMSGVEHFDDSAAINPFMDASVPVDRAKAAKEHAAIKAALESAGVTVHQRPAPAGCQDGVYTANWALVRGDTALLSRLPNAREAETPHAANLLRELGFTITEAPADLRFSGQGDALPCGNLLFCGSTYRSDAAVHRYVADMFGYETISLQTIPQLDATGTPVINTYSGWPDSFFYDIDLAISILKNPYKSDKGLIAWCPEAFTPKSRRLLQELNSVDKIEVSMEEAKLAYACNLVSTGETVVMSSRAPQLRSQVEDHGLKTITPEITELAKGGGYIRCTTLTLDTI